MGTWEIIIADEVHHFRSWKSLRTKSLKVIPAFYRWGLTGTPVNKSVEEYWCPLNWYNSGVFPGVMVWRQQFCEYDFMGKYTGPKNVEALATTLASYILRRKMVDVIDEVAQLDSHIVPLQMEPEQAKKYKELKTECFVEMSREGIDIGSPVFIKSCLTRLQFLRLLALYPPLLGYDFEGVKTQWLTQWYEDYGGIDPFIVFSHSRVFADSLPDWLPGGVTISGSVNIQDRDKALTDFKEGKYKYIAGTLDTMSESINLQCARTAIFMEQDHSLIKMEQAKARIRRMDSALPITIYEPYVVGTVDVLIMHALRKRWTDQHLIEEFVKHIQEGQ
jgi:SNF2 family DNA or RNA helicase